MAYTVDPTNGDIIIGGFDQGIGESPYAGLTDLKSVNPSSIPGEASVAFATKSVTLAPALSFTANTGVGGTFGINGGGNLLELHQAFYITSVGATGLQGGTQPYYVSGVNRSGGLTQSFGLATTYGTTASLSTGNGTISVVTYNPAQPKFFEEAWTQNSAGQRTNFMIDAKGQVWSDNSLTDLTNSWTFTGNIGNSGNIPDVTANGNGLVYWRTANSTSIGDWDGWLFIFRDGAIDYSNVDGVNQGVGYKNIGVYNYGWNPSTGTINQASYLSGVNLSNCPHNAINGPDGNVYFCDYFTMWKIQQTNIVAPVTFSPTNTASYIFTHAHNLPDTEVATCISPFGTNFIIGGMGNQAYVWNGVDQLTVSYPILLAESYVSQIVTVNTNAYIFAGNRGNIYITNGSQANVWKKIPDHISGIVEPYFQWGGATYNKGKLYFGVNATNNFGTNISGYGGLWSIDLETRALWNSNQLSYGTYTGYASALFSLPPGILTNPKVVANLPINPLGNGIIVGWVNNGTFGIDSMLSTPYTGTQATVVSDMIPVGTLLRPTTATQLEYKLATPLQTGESVQLLMGSSMSDYANNTFTSVGTTNGTGVELGGNFPINVQAQQWLLVKANLTSIGTLPSYVRLTQLRVIGGTSKDTVPNQPFSIA